MRQWRIVPLLAGSLAASGLTITSLTAEDRTQARSMVISQYGIVAAEQPIAARAGTAVLERGGNAVDAAVAATAAMGRLPPTMDGIRGALFATVDEATANQGYAPHAPRWGPHGRRDIPQSRPRPCTRGNRQRGAGRLLQGDARKTHSRYLDEVRRHHGGGRPCGIRGRVGRSDFD